MRNPATQSTIRINNQELIIEHILENGATSRANISKELNISKPTVSSNTEKLISQNILKEIGEGKSSGGRKPTLLDINYDYKIIIAIDLNRNEPLLALSNLSGDILDQESIEVSLTDGKTVLTKKLTESINHLINVNGYDLKQLGAISIAIPGVIDESTGEVFANPQFNLWTELNLIRILKSIYGVTVIMKNDISMAALGEKHYGMGKFYDDLVYVSSGLGIGAGIIIDGKLHEGKRKAAGEVGYSKIFGVKTNDNLEDRITTTAIIKRVKDDLKSGIKTNILDYCEKEISIKAINTSLKSGDEYICNLVVEIGTALGMIVSNIALILDLEIVILGGVLNELGDYFLKTVRDVVEKSLPFDTIVRKSELGKIAGVYGLLVIAKEAVMKGLVE